MKKQLTHLHYIGLNTLIQSTTTMICGKNISKG